MKQDVTLSLANVYKRFGDLEAVSDVTLTINRGEIVGFVGPNGAGKTTTISILMGFIAPTKGKATVLGTLITPETAHAVHRFVGYVAGDMMLPSQLTGKQFLAFCASQNGRDDKHFKHLTHLLTPVLDKPLITLSRGNKQKIALIAALQHAPQVLILDEPTSGLDPLMQDVFLKTIQAESRRGTTVFMSSHILSEVSFVCDRIVFMKAGKFIVDKPVTAILEQLGKHVIITSHEAKKLIDYLPDGVQQLSHNGKEVRLSVPPEALKVFMRWLLTKNFDDIVIENRDLDDVFHELYITSGKRAR
jgi:ABC-2 type transport system ATP-binding protein